MAGLYHDFYKGNLSELLADYLLSGIGISTPVRRQFDTGVDFYCNLMDNETGYLTFGSPFSIQIKSSSTPNVVYGGNTPKKWKKEKILWLFRHEIPFFIGIVDKEIPSIKIYDTSGIWQLFSEPDRNFSQVIFKPGKKTGSEWRKNVDRKTLKGWDKSDSNKTKYIIDMGNPIIEITYDDIKKKKDDVLKKKKQILRTIINIEQRNINFRNLGIYCFHEIKRNLTDVEWVEWGMNIKSNFQKEYIFGIYESLRMPLISLANNLQYQQRNEESNLIKEVLKLIPQEPFYPDLLRDSPEYFNWIKELNESQRPRS